MTLMTDGVIEARGGIGSFMVSSARLRSRTTRGVDWRAAQEFGQEDDITVLTLTRVTARQEPISQFTSPCAFAVGGIEARFGYACAGLYFRGEPGATSITCSLGSPYSAGFYACFRREMSRKLHCPERPSF